MFTSKFVSAVIVVVFLISGCDTPELDVEGEQATASSSTASQAKAIEERPEKDESAYVTEEVNGNEANLSAVFESWASGAKDEAVGKLLQINWESPTAIGDLSIMNITETQFAALSGSEKEKEQAVAMKLTSDAKAVLRHVFSVAEQAQEEGDNAKAKSYYEAVQELGNALASPERLAVMQMMGKSLVQMAGEKLAEQK